MMLLLTILLLFAAGGGYLVGALSVAQAARRRYYHAGFRAGEDKALAWLRTEAHKVLAERQPRETHHAAS